VFGDNDVNLTPNTAGGLPATSPPPTSFSSDNCAAWVTGGCPVGALSCGYGGLGFTFLDSEGAYDISAYTGLEFSYEGDDLYVIVHMTGARTFGTHIPGSPGALGLRQFSFSELMPSGDTPVSAIPDFSAATKVEFTTLTPDAFGQAIYSVRLY
jgi:hypothetical protein